MQSHGDMPADRLRRQLRAMAEFGLHAFRSEDLDEILHRACELVSEGLDVKYTKVLELLPGGDEVLVRAGVNWKPGVVGYVRFGAHEQSPAGHALAHGEPVVSPDVSTETRFEIPQVLVDHGIQSMINVIIAGEQGPFGVLEVDAHERRDFEEDDVAFLKNYANLLAAAIERIRATRALQDSANHQRLLAEELAHRVRNTIGLVQALAAQSPAGDEGARQFRASLVGRLQALAAAESLILEEQNDEIDLGRLVARTLEPFERDGRGDIVVAGPPLRLPSRCGRILGLVLHELGTNATRHGALKALGGRARVGWSVRGSGDQRRLDLHWREEGGPEVSPPRREGFGTRLLRELVGFELDGKADLDHARGGLSYRLEFPLPGGSSRPG